MKIQPIDGFELVASDPLKQPARSRLKRLFEWQFARDNHRDSQDEFEPNSVCLTKMVRNFMEGNAAEKHSVRCSQHHGRSSSCFNGNYIDNSDDDDGYYFCRGCADSLNADKSCELLKGLVCCMSSLERNLLADTTKIAEKNSKICSYSCKNKTDCRKAVMEGLVVLGYDASICKSKWEETTSYPSGEHEYIDVMIQGERVLIDIDFKSEFEIARSTRNYRTILQALPTIFVGKSEPLEQIVSIMSDAAKQSLKKKGMHIPPWRKVEYMKSKWLSPYTTTRIPKTSVQTKTNKFSGDFELVLFQEKKSRKCGDSVDQHGKIKVVVTPWEPPAIKPKSAQRGFNTVAGLASIFKDKY